MDTPTTDFVRGSLAAQEPRRGVAQDFGPISLALPAAYGTTSVTGRVGQSWAVAIPTLPRSRRRL
jgi:hypothetical protein